MIERGRPRRGYVALAVALTAALLAAGCGGGSQEAATAADPSAAAQDRRDAEAVVRAYFTGLATGDGDAVCASLIPPRRVERAAATGGTCRESVQPEGAGTDPGPGPERGYAGAASGSRAGTSRP